MRSAHTSDLLPVRLVFLLGALSFVGVSHSQTNSRVEDRLYPAMAEPWTSGGLTPVDLTSREGLADLVLSENGQAKVKIVTVNTDDWYYPAIAELLKTYLDKCTGAQFEVVVGAVPPGRHIFVGPVDEPTVKSVFAESQKRSLDGLQVVSFKRGLILVGRDCLSPYATKPPKRLNLYTQNTRRTSTPSASVWS